MFKGQLSYNDILYGMSYRQLLELKAARVERLVEEAEDLDKKTKAQRSQEIRNDIMRK